MSARDGVLCRRAGALLTLLHLPSVGTLPSLDHHWHQCARIVMVTVFSGLRRLEAKCRLREAMVTPA